MLDTVKSEGRTALMEIEAAAVFRAYGLPLAESILAGDQEEAVQAAEKLGYPVVLKIASPDILHKTDAKGVKVGIGNPAEVRTAFTEILANAKAYKAEAKIAKDVTFRIAPISVTEAKSMVMEINAYPIIKGARGEKPRDQEALADALSRLSQLTIDFPEIKELDANPVLLYEKGMIVVDARIIL
ncbi:MAG: acetate--CoA ligase family protein [Coprothermobacterota bacterium]|nr:acetate--CoA ligase family protein [Coprothermobacterota bacterium]